MRVSAAAFEHTQQVTQYLLQKIERSGGWLAFRDWMAEVLYAPGLGYYTAGSHKLALRSEHEQRSLTGDFVTAPELSAAFGRTLARQMAQVMKDNGLSRILEFGAGSGQLACDVLDALHREGMTDIDYQILEISDDLRVRQQALLKHTPFRVTWLDRIPDGFAGIVVANEVLDAMPVHIVRWSEDGQVNEMGVVAKDRGFTWEERRAAPALAEHLARCMPPLPGYTTEISLDAQAWIRTLAGHLQRGLILLVDYGFTQTEFYHPQRSHGTLMCHIQHRAHDDPFFAPGLQDITAHVDFSAIAATAHQSGLDVLGYTSQARFLLNAGLHEVLQQDPQLQTPSALRALEKLISEAEMGELFKVLALGRGIETPLEAFRRSDRRHQL